MCSRDRSRWDRHPALVAGVSDAVQENTKGRAAAGNTAPQKWLRGRDLNLRPLGCEPVPI
jgi:hypothetical protein